MHIHKIISGEKEYKLNFGSYAVMQVYRKHGIEGLNAISIHDLNFDMIKFGMSDNGKNDISDSDVYEFIDGLEGGMYGDLFKNDINRLVQSAFNIPETKKNEIAEEV